MADMVKDFDCKCGKCGLKSSQMSLSFIEKFTMAELISQTDFVITSGIRCPEYNKKVGGSETSSHLTGDAADIKVITSRQRYIIVKALLQSGFKRIGIGKTFIHVDDDPAKPKKLIWLY